MLRGATLLSVESASYNFDVSRKGRALRSMAAF